MNFINQHKPAIITLCEKHHVKKLYVFGSVLTDRFDANSDVDLVVEFQIFDLKFYADNYYDLKFSLQDILKRPVDMLEQQAIKNPYLEQSIQVQKQLIYAS